MNPAARNLFIVLGVVALGFLVYYGWDIVRERSRSEKLAFIVHLEDQRKLDEQLYKLLGDDSAEIRARAAMAVGRIGGNGTAERLFPLLKDDSLSVALTAAFAIGQSGEKGVALRLAESAADLAPVAGREALISAGRLADSTSQDLKNKLSEFLSSQSPEIREGACRGLFFANAKDKVPQLVALFQTEPDDDVKREALYALARLGSTEGSAIYVNYLANPDPFTRGLAVRGLQSVSSEEASHYLAIALNDGDKGVVAQAVRALAPKKTVEAMDKLCAKLFHENDEKLVVELLTALKSQANPCAIATVRDMLATDSSRNILVAGIAYIAEIEKTNALGLLDSMSTHSNPFVRASCARSYGLTASDKITSRAAILFADEDPLVRNAALETLFGTDSFNVDFYISKAFTDRDFTVTSTAIEQIKIRKLTRYLRDLRTLFDRTGLDDIDLRRGAVDVAKAFLAAGPDTIARSILIKAMTDEEYIVRREAALAAKEVLGEDHLSAVQFAKTKITERELKNAFETMTANPIVTVSTSKGKFTMELHFEIAPLTVLNFVSLVKDKYYDGLSFHRVVPNFVVQGGDPRGDGSGGPGYMIRCEYTSTPYKRGTVGIATSGKDTGGSQWFVTLSPQPHLEGRYTVFAEVISGMEIVDQIVPGDIIQAMNIGAEAK
jgi:cyclophilin family peptidyl-prolyl cis-trans isomerase/HEAT repeat protein